MVYAIKHFHHYIYGNRFTIRAGHGSMRWLLNFKINGGQLARMLAFLLAYDSSFKHRADRLHSNCDAISRMPYVEADLNTVRKWKTDMKVRMRKGEVYEWYQYTEFGSYIVAFLLVVELG